MIVRMKVNLGIADAKAHGLDQEQCQAGAELDVEDIAGQWLANHGHAEIVLKAVPKAPVTAVPPAPTVKTRKAKDE